jgi:hypothetical protein
MTQRRSDLLVHGEGSIYLLRAVSRRGQKWLDEHIEADAQEWAGAVVVEHRFIGDIVSGAIADGLRASVRHPMAPAEKPIPGADDELAARVFGAAGVAESRWADVNRRFNELLGGAR